MEKNPSFYSPKTGFYKSRLNPVQIPSNPSLSMIEFLLRNAPNYPDRTALIDADSGDSITFGQLESAIASIAVALSKFKISKGDVALIFAPNCIEFPLCFFAVISLGGIATTVNPLYTVNEISKQAEDSNPKIVITVEELLPKVEKLDLPIILLKNPAEKIKNLNVFYLPELVSSSVFDGKLRGNCLPESVNSSVFEGQLKGNNLPEPVNSSVFDGQLKGNNLPESINSSVFDGKLKGNNLPESVNSSVFVGKLKGNCLPELINSSVVSDFDSESVKQDDLVGLLYSSGTTGVNKGVELTHRNFISASIMMTREQDLRGYPPQICLCFLPMFHIFGLSVITYAQLQRGNSVVIMGRFDLERMLGVVERFKVSMVMLVPPVLIAMVKQGKVKEYDLSSLRRIISGAAPLGKDVMEEASALLPGVEISQGYGLTESCGIISLEMPIEGPRKYGSAGFLVPGVEGKVIHTDTGSSLPPNQLGELCFRGQNIMRGYFKNLEATRSTLDEDGWLHTGDLGYFDDNGELYVVDRIKELIKYKGFQVAPAELEGLLLSHPDILDAVVIPYPDDEAGEVPVAYVVRAKNSSLSEIDVQKFIADQVAPFKRLRQVSFIDSVPKSASGKILRRLLVEKVRSRQ